MFNAGDKVINSDGVACIIDRIEKMKVPHSRTTKNYYVMHDLIKTDNVYYVPQDSSDSMRMPIKREEAQNLIDKISYIQPVEIEEERFRDKEYRMMIRESSPLTLVALLKYFINKKEVRKQQGKTLSSIDEKYMKLVSRNLFSELVCSLGIGYDHIEKLIYDKITC